MTNPRHIRYKILGRLYKKKIFYICCKCNKLKCAFQYFLYNGESLVFFFPVQSRLGHEEEIYMKKGIEINQIIIQTLLIIAVLPFLPVYNIKDRAHRALYIYFPTYNNKVDLFSIVVKIIV